MGGGKGAGLGPVGPRFFLMFGVKICLKIIQFDKIFPLSISNISSLYGVNNIFGDMGTTHNAKKMLKLDEIGFKNGFSEI